MELFFTDEAILEKTKEWSDIMERYSQDDHAEEYKFTEIRSGSNEESDRISDDNSPNQTTINNNNNNDETKNTCKALVKVENNNNFEGETSSDDMDEFANKTAIAIKEQQKKKWKECGMLDVLETFDFNKISKVVAPWIEKNKLDKTQHSSSIDEHIVHIEEHHHRQVHLESDDDSLHSLDTANYIRSSRKKKSSHCTTTTIKKFSYVKGSRSQLAKKLGLNSFSDMFNNDLPQKALKAIRGSERCLSSNVTPPTQPKPDLYAPRSLPERRRKSRQLKRRSDVSKRSVSSSSSSSSGSPVRSKFRKNSKKSTPKAQLPKPRKKSVTPVKRRPRASKKLVDIDLTNLASTDDDGGPKYQPELPKANARRPEAASNASNETGFLGASLINSTALANNTNQPASSVVPPSRQCLLTPIKKRLEQPAGLEKTSSPPPPVNSAPIPAANIKPVTVKLRRQVLSTEKVAEKVPATKPKSIQVEENPNVPESAAHATPVVVEDKSKILLYSPNKIDEHKENLSGPIFFLTKDFFLKKVGQKNSRRFIMLNCRKFPFEFNRNSRIYFKVPDESANSASSDEDILEMFGREGNLIVETVM